MRKTLFSIMLLFVPASQGAVLTWQGSRAVSSPSDVAVSADGNYIYTASPTGDMLQVYARNADGTVGSLLQTVSDGGMVYPWRLLLSGDDLYVATRSLTGSADAVLLFHRDGDGKVSTAPVESHPVTTPSGLAVSEAGDQVYVRSAGTDSLIVYGRDTVTGSLSPLQTLGSLPGDGEVVASSDGRFVYASSVDDSSVTVFARDPSTQFLTPVRTYRNGVSGVSNLGGAWGLALSGDQKHLYIGNSAESSIAVFGRDDASGELTFERVYRQGGASTIGNTNSPFDGLTRPLALRMSPDGQRLYVGSVTSGSESTLAVLRSDPVDASLAFVEVHGSATEAGLGGALRYAFSPDGGRLYSAGLGDGNIGVFEHASADLGVVIQDAADPVAPGGVIDYSLIVTNNSSADADGAALTEVLPAGTTFVSADHPGCTEDTGVVQCELGLLPIGMTTVNVEVTAPAVEGPITSRAVVYSAFNDPNPADNADQEDTEVSAFVNTAPTAVSDVIQTLPGQAITFDIVANDVDPDGQPLAIVPGSVQPQSVDTPGTLVVSGAGQVIYTPPAAQGGKAFTGKAHFTYRVSDGIAESADGLITVIVNTPPTAVDDGATVTSGMSVKVLVLANDSDADGDVFDLASVDGSALIGGSVTKNGDGTITYTADPSFTGTEAVTYTIVDGNEGVGTATLTIDVIGPVVVQGNDGSGSTNPSVIRHGGGAATPWFLILLLLSLIRPGRNPTGRRYRDRLP